jgi:hypothetical protein
MLDFGRLRDIDGVSRFPRRFFVREFGRLEHHDVNDQIQDVALGNSGTAKTNRRQPDLVGIVAISIDVGLSLASWNA